MDAFDGDRRIGHDNVFPGHIASFPEASFDFLYHYQHSNPAAPPSSEEAEVIAPRRRGNLPLQKLRPIRCSARFPLVAADLLRCDDVGLGFLSSGCCAVDRLPIPPCPVQTSGVEDVTRNVKMGSSEDESCSSDAGYDSSLDAAAEPTMIKKRGRWRKRFKVTIENMVFKVMERQELMYMQLIETIEHREKERINREETWQQQQMERSEQNEKLITQEMTRNAALIALVEKILVHEIPQKPKSFNSFLSEEQHQGNEGPRRWLKSEVDST